MIARAIRAVSKLSSSPYEIGVMAEQVDLYLFIRSRMAHGHESTHTALLYEM
jgi:hypothetical protein